jgi:Ala-tRNA(Pro) deacylase
MTIEPAAAPERTARMHERLGEFLNSHAVRYDTVGHPVAMTAQEQAAVLHVRGATVAKVVIVKERDGLIMAVLPASHVLDLNRLKGLIGHGDVRLASIEEIRDVVPDCLPGAIPPFGTLYGLPTYVDRELLNAGEITMPAGDLERSIRMRVSEFRRLHAFREGDFAAPDTLMAPAHTTQRPRVPRRSPRRRAGAAGRPPTSGV